jgi:hypothetical protein
MRKFLTQVLIYGLTAICAALFAIGVFFGLGSVIYIILVLTIGLMKAVGL